MSQASQDQAGAETSAAPLRAKTPEELLAEDDAARLEATELVRELVATWKLMNQLVLEIRRVDPKTQVEFFTRDGMGNVLTIPNVDFKVLRSLI